MTFTANRAHPYTVSSTRPGSGSAEGDLARVGPGPRLELADSLAGERVFEALHGDPLSTADVRHLHWSARIRIDGGVTADLTAIDHAALVQRLTVSTADLTQIEQDCTVTLPNGKQGCYDPSGRRLCGDPPVPCPSPLPAADRPVIVASQTFRPGTTSLGAGRTSLRGQLPRLVGRHRYAITLCAIWWRFLTTADYAAPDAVARAVSGDHETCDTSIEQPPKVFEPVPTRPERLHLLR